MEIRLVCRELKKNLSLWDLTLFFSSVVDFDNVTKACKPMEVIGFLNNLYNTMDERMDKHDVYKVESISDSYLVASGLPKRNGDK